MTLERTIELMQELITTGAANKDDEAVVCIPGPEGCTAFVAAVGWPRVVLDADAPHPAAIMTFCRRGPEPPKIDPHQEWKGARI